VELAVLTSRGREAAGLSGEPSKRLGGVAREYWKHRVADHLGKEGYEVQLEAPVGNGQTIDVLSERGDETLAIEIETGKSDVGANVRKCPTGRGRTVFLVTEKNILPKVEQILRESQRPGIEAWFAPDFIRSLPSTDG